MFRKKIFGVQFWFYIIQILFLPPKCTFKVENEERGDLQLIGKKKKIKQSLFDQWFKSEFKWICLNEFHPETP